MGIQCGIVGLPNVGKSTLFNALTRAGIEASNYPFCTIEPNVGVVAVPDLRIDALAAIAQSKKIIPTAMEFVDIAGLVAGASKGEGLGNQFLANIRETHAIAHVVRCFDDDDVTHVAGAIDPAADIEVIHTELALADLETLERALQKMAKLVKSGDKKALAEQAVLERARDYLNAGRPLRSLTLDEQEQALLNTRQLLTAKPTVYIANVAEEGFENNPYLEKVQAIANEEGAEVVAVCAAIESELVDLEAAEAQEFLSTMGLTEPGLNRVIRAAYHLLKLRTFFTVGPKETRAWTIQVGASAPQAAGAIHSDFEKGFIRAEVIAYQAYLDHQGEGGAKDAGQWRQEGKDYLVQDGDVILFRFNV